MNLKSPRACDAQAYFCRRCCFYRSLVSSSIYSFIALILGSDDAHGILLLEGTKAIDTMVVNFHGEEAGGLTGQARIRRVVRYSSTCTYNFSNHIFSPFAGREPRLSRISFSLSGASLEFRPRGLDHDHQHYHIVYTLVKRTSFATHAVTLSTTKIKY